MPALDKHDSPLPTTTVKWRMPAVHPEGRQFVVIAGAVALVAYFLISHVLGALLLVGAGCVAAFFRDPVRVTPVREGIVVAAADGRIASVGNAPPPPELDLGIRPLPRVSIFMSVFNCHVNRSPMGGRIEAIVYQPGAFVSADLDKASEENERNAFVIASGNARIAVVQIAGLVARRIVCFVHKGASVGAGERIGMIRFGSRVDIYLPEGVRPLVAEGQTSVAGETVIADLRPGDRDRTFRVN